MEKWFTEGRMKKYLPFIAIGGILLVLIFLTYWEPPKRDDLDKSIWKVVNLNNTELVEGTTLTIRFHNQKISGSSGCNTFKGRYELNGEEIRLSILEQTTTNCLKPEIMDQERLFIGYLKKLSAFGLSGEQLITTTVDGARVEFAWMASE